MEMWFHCTTGKHRSQSVLLTKDGDCPLCVIDSRRNKHDAKRILLWLIRKWRELLWYC